MLTDQEFINREVVNYFSSSFNGEVMEDHDLHSIMDIIPTCVKEQHNKMLLRVVSLEEVKAAFFGMGENKAPGPDGFLSLFFQHF